MASSSLYFFLFLLYFNLPHNSADQHHQQQCPLFTCGSFGQVGFPFASTSNPDCGSFVLNCTDPVPKIQFSEELGWYPVENISYSDKRITIYDLHLQDQLNSNHCNALKTLEPSTSSVHFSLATPAFSSIVCDRSKSRDSSEEQFFQSLQNFTGCVDNYDLHFTKDYNTTVPPMPDQLLNHCIIDRLPRFQYWQNLSTWAYSVHEASVFTRLESRPISYRALKPGPIYGGHRGEPYEKQRPEHNPPPPPPPPPQQPQRSNFTKQNPSPPPLPSPPPVTQQPQRSNFTKQNPSPPPLPPPPPVTQQPQRSNFTQQNSSEPVKKLTSLSSAIYTLSWEITQDCIRCQQLKVGLCQEDANGKFQCGSFKGGGKGRRREVIIALSISISSFLLIMMILCRCTRKTYLTITNSLVFGKRSKNTQLFEDFLRNHASLAPKRYSYSDIRKMTNSFKDKLGEGGFGGVFKGKLPDGSFIAVKVLKESKGNGEDFINEVASISKTSHVNVVTLLGFCYEGSKRALVYEFMPNGSLDKFIYNKTSNTTCSPLNLEMLYEIAIGIARGLEYLHRGCSTRIVHFDIKPHNILLDENFSPKISDFGLAKLCERKDSILSMLGARGTIGYIAPELVYAHHRGVSYKSDVYSYGMMVLEMVGGRRNTEVGVDRTSEIYFPYWIHQRLEQEDLRLHGVESEAEREIAKKMSVVGLWCIQTNPCDRPSMSRVLDMLEGSLESLEISPKPFVYLPERSPVDSSAN